jgi:mono/diheme cytochrome c family protein
LSINSISSLAHDEGKSFWFLGTVMTLKASAETTGGAFSLIEQTAPVGFAPPRHIYLAKDEAFYILEGEATFFAGDEVSNVQHVSAPAAGITNEYRKYLVTISGCNDCHGADLAGGSYPQPGVSMLVPNITPAGEPGSWTEAQFLAAMRTGVRPDGHPLDAELMPWTQIGKSTDDELKAIWLYIKSVPAVKK